MRYFDSVVLLSPFSWDGVWQTSHYLARGFAERLPVLYVEPAPPWNPRDGNFELKKLIRGQARRRPRQPVPRLHVLTPPTAPFGRRESVRRINRRFYAGAVRKACARLGLRAPLLWVSYYIACLENVEDLRGQCHIYHCLDYFDRPEERELSRRADLVLAVSQPLVDSHASIARRVRLLPNGVDLKWFPADPAGAGPRPADLPDGHLIGFVGNISRHVDVSLLVQVARAFPSHCLVAIGPLLTPPLGPVGPQAQALGELRSLGNVRLLGFRPPHQLARYMAAFSVCLICFRQEEWGGYADPLKFYQYLALGKPVVTTPCSVAERNSRLCYLAATPQAYLAQLDDALREPADPALAAARRKVAWAHGWEHIVAQAWQHLEEAGVRVQHG